MVLIDMEKPEYCDKCEYVTDSFGYCELMKKHIPDYRFFGGKNEIPAWCPIKGTSDVKPIEHGEWVDYADKLDAQFGRHEYICSNCGHAATNHVGGTENWWCISKPNYCPNCGAKMDGEVTQ